MRNQLQKFVNEIISFEYSGPDHPNGQLGSQEIIGELTRVDLSTFEIKTEEHQSITLTIDDVQKSSIKRRKMSQCL